jgi:hypothetical protein
MEPRIEETVQALRPSDSTFFCMYIRMCSRSLALVESMNLRRHLRLHGIKPALLPAVSLQLSAESRLVQDDGRDGPYLSGPR